MNDSRSRGGGGHINHQSRLPSRRPASTIAALESIVASVLQDFPSAADAPYVVAVSGGPDSMALLDVLKRIHARRGSFCFIAAHLNHHIRGAEADRDEAFVRKLSEKLGIEL